MTSTCWSGCRAATTPPEGAVRTIDCRTEFSLHRYTSCVRGACPQLVWRPTARADGTAALTSTLGQADQQESRTVCDALDQHVRGVSDVCRQTVGRAFATPLTTSKAHQAERAERTWTPN